jgi:D-sedoheptulose 7-phosphate isomerase
MTHFSQVVADHLSVLQRLAQCQSDVERAGQMILDTIVSGGKILLCGNGGSAADCQHIAAEFIVRYANVRRSLPAIALTTDTSILTAHPNDFSFSTVFARQIEGLGNPGDCLIAISTSGNSENILEAAKVAREKGITVIGMTGESGGALGGLVDCAVCVPSTVTARIQEAHILIAHWWCQIAEESIA